MHLTGMHAIDHWYNSVLVSWRACMGHTKNAGECDSSMPRACCILVKWEGGRAVLFTYAVEVWKDSSMALSSPGLIWSSCLQTVQSPTWTLMVIGTSSFCLWFFPSLSHGKEIFKCNPSLMASQHQFQSNRTEIFTFYILNTREIDTRAALWEALKLWSIYAHLINCNCCLDTREWTQTRG